jgi:hypothetical protein
VLAAAAAGRSWVQPQTAGPALGNRPLKLMFDQSFVKLVFFLP